MSLMLFGGGYVFIPVIGSINCRSSKWWPDFAEKIEKAGADALELNVYKIPIDPKTDGSEIEKEYFDIVKIVKNRASGYRNLDSFADLIYLTVGDLDIPAHIPSQLRTL